MKKKTVTIRDNTLRKNTPEPILKKKPQKQKIKANPINEDDINNVNKKTTILKNPGPITVHPTITNMNNLSKMANNKTTILKNSELNKSSIDIKKKIKIESKALNTESKINLGHKKVIKFKKENLCSSQKNIKEKNNSTNKDIKNQNDKGKDNKALLNKSEDTIKKAQTIRYKDDNRGKSFDMAVEKKKKRAKEAENENNKTLENNTKKRKPEIELEKTQNKTKTIIKKDIIPIKTEKFNDKKEIKFPLNKSKKKILNKTPDAGKMRNNNKLISGNINKKQKYGNVGNIKSILRSNHSKKKEIINNNDIQLNENRDNKDKNDNKDNKDNNDKNDNNENKINEVKIIKYKNIKNKKYNSNYVESLYLAINSGFFNPNKKLNIFINSKELYSNFEDKKMIKELIDYYNKKGNQIIINNNDIKKYDIKKINEPFKPNERTINALNFLDKNEEKKLINEIQHPYINELFKAVLILLNEYKNNNDNKNIFEFLFNDILPKYKAKNIKKLMVKFFVDDRLIINDEQLELIQKMLITKPDLFSPATLLRYNRAVAYFSFFIKELFSYLNLKTEDGKYYYKIRESLPKNKYLEKINKLRQLL